MLRRACTPAAAVECSCCSPGFLQPGARQWKLSSSRPSTSCSVVHLHIVTKNTVAKSGFWTSQVFSLVKPDLNNSLLTGLASLHLSKYDQLGKNKTQRLPSCSVYITSHYHFFQSLLSLNWCPSVFLQIQICKEC